MWLVKGSGFMLFCRNKENGMYGECYMMIEFWMFEGG